MTFLFDLSKTVVAFPNYDLSLNFTYVRANNVYYKRCRLSVLPATSFMAEVRELLPHLLLVADRSFTTSKPRHTCYTMNTNIRIQLQQQIVETPVY